MTTTAKPPTTTKRRPLPGDTAADDFLPPPAIRRGLRRTQGLTQEQAAAEFGVSDGSISNWERLGPGPRHLPRYLAKLLEWSAAARAKGYQVDWPTPTGPQK